MTSMNWNAGSLEDDETSSKSTLGNNRILKFMFKEKEVCTQMTVTGAQTQIYIELRLQIETQERAEVFIISGKYATSNLIEMSDRSYSDSDNE